VNTILTSFCRLTRAEGDSFPCLCRSGELYRLDNRGDARFHDIGTMLRTFGGSLGRVLDSLPVVGPPVARLADVLAGNGPFTAAAPVDQQEVWGAGMTFSLAPGTLSDLQRERPLYADVYLSERPMLFFKSSPWCVLGDGRPISCRKDAHRTIPEAELAVLLAPDGEPVAYSLGNDVTAVDIENRNPLYQPQAKVFQGSCALGPSWRFVAEEELRGLDVGWTLERAGQKIAGVRYNLSKLAMSVRALCSSLAVAGHLRHGAVLLVGSGAPCPPDVALKAGDLVHVWAEGFEMLTNPVSQG